MQSRRDFLVSSKIYLVGVTCSLNFFISSYSGLQVNLKLNLIELGMKDSLTVWNFILLSKCRTSMGLERSRDTNSLIWYINGVVSNSSRLEIGIIFLSFSSYLDLVAG